jgi:hypothetical protein
MMTPRERVLAVLRRERLDKLPRELKLTPPLFEEFERRTGATDPAEYFPLEVRDVFFAPPTETTDFSAYYPEGLPRFWNPAGWEVGEWGVGVTDGSMRHFIHLEHSMKRLTKVEELDRYPFPRSDAAGATRPPRSPGPGNSMNAACSSSALWSGRSSKLPGTDGALHRHRL